MGTLRMPEMNGGQPGPTPEEMAFAVTRFVHLLRCLGVRVSITETEDVFRALSFLDISDKEQVRSTLEALLVKNLPDRQVFREAFSLFFLPRKEFDFCVESFRREKEREESRLRMAGEEFASLVRGWEGEIKKEELLTPDNIRVFSLLPEKAKERLKNAIVQAKANPVNSPGRLVFWAVRSALSYWRYHLRQDYSLDLPDGQVFLNLPDGQILAEDMQKISSENLAAYTEMIRRLSSRLAKSLARRYRKSRSAGALDFRRTFRRNIRRGGVPLELYYRRRRNRQPELIMICDVSASMSRYAQFVLQFIYGLGSALERSEGFIFSEDLERITSFLRGEQDFSAVMTGLINKSRQWGRTTNFAAALDTFRREYKEVIRPECILVVLSDTKTVAWEEAARKFAELAGKVKKAVWLNPVPANQWQDLPAAGAFQKSARMFECNSLYHLEKIFRLLIV
jgi:uncharacterized protein with von Willebrand factor type A (vWA) domain